jgi:hypothetical protein
MADNTVLPGTGETYAADDIGGAKYQRIKMVHGADGVNDGDIAATNPLPVKLQSQDTTAEVSTTPLANGASFTTAWFDTQDAPHGFTVAVSSDVAGHTYHEESPNNDGTNIILADDFAYTQAEMVAGVDEEHISHTRYSRFRITNDSGGAQASLIYSVTQRFLDGYGTVKISASANDVTAHGDKEHNTATPSTEAVEALTAVAKAAAPTYGEGNMVAPRVTLSGDTAVTLDGEAVVINGGAAQTSDIKVTLDSELIVLGTGSAAIGKLAANSGIDIGDVDVTTLPAITIAAAQTLTTVTTVGTVTTLTGGGVAHGGSDSGNPIKLGAKAETSLAGITPVSDTQRTDLYADSDGVQFVKLFPEADLITERIADTAGNSTAFTNFAATASARNLIYAISIFNASATDGYVDFRDGTAGAILWTAPAPKGGGSVIVAPFPLFKSSVNTALAYDVSEALTTVYISVTGRKSKVA